MQKNPLINAVASFIIPGLGQIINGDVNKGIAMVGAMILLNLFIYFFLNNPLGHVLSLAYSIYAAYDAYTNY